MLTVTAKLKPIIVLSHLLTGLSILSVLWWSYLSLKNSDVSQSQKSSSPYLPWLCMGIVVILLQITLGGWVSTHYAGLACIDLPYCNGKILPYIQWSNLNQDLIGIHMLHRFGAVVTAAYITILSIMMLSTKALRALAITMLILVCFQFTLGVLNVLWLRPVWIALMHHAVAIILLITTITATAKSLMQRDGHYV